MVLNPVEERVIVHTASANLLGKVLVYPAKVTVLLRPLGRFTEEVVSTHGGGRTDPVARLTGTPHAVPRFDGEPFPVLLLGTSWSLDSVRSLAS